MATVAKRKKVSTFQFEDLPVEISIKVMRYLDITDLVRFTRVSKRIRALGQDESLWQKVDLSWKRVSYSFVQFVLEKKCKHLILHGTILIGKTQLLIGNTLKFTKICQLKHLDLGECEINERVMNYLLSSCHNLESFSLEYLDLQPHTIKRICLQNGKTLQKLDLETETWNRQLQLESISDIVNHCSELTELNLSQRHLPEDALRYLANNLSPKILKLSLGGCQNLTDEHVETLVKRCNKITELALGHTHISNITLTNIIENLKYTLEKLDLTYCWVQNLTKYYELKSMPKLKYLRMANLSNDEVVTLKNKLPNVKISRDFLTIAKFIVPPEKESMYDYIRLMR